MNTPLHLLTAISVVLTFTLSSSLSWAAASRDRPQSLSPDQPTSGLPLTVPVVSPKQVALRYVPPRPTGGSSRPGTRRGAASRGCLVLAQVTHDPMLDNLVALVPETQTQATNLTQVWGQTSTPHPTLWFYNPYKGESIQSIEFVLQDEQDEDVFRTPIAVPQTTGLISVTVPAKISLQPGNAYHWYLKIYGKDPTQCGKKPDSTAADPLTPPPDPAAMVITPLVYVDGWIVYRPLEPAIASQLKQGAAQQQAALYAEKGFWYDTVNALAAARQGEANNTALSADWITLLQQVGLEKLAAQPLVKCCSLSSSR